MSLSYIFKFKSIYNVNGYDLDEFKINKLKKKDVKMITKNNWGRLLRKRPNS